MRGYAEAVDRAMVSNGPGLALRSAADQIESHARSFAGHVYVTNEEYSDLCQATKDKDGILLQTWKAERNNALALLKQTQAERDALQAQAVIDAQIAEGLRERCVRLTEERDRAFAMDATSNNKLNDMHRELARVTAERDEAIAQGSHNLDLRDADGKMYEAIVLERDAAQAENARLRGSIKQILAYDPLTPPGAAEGRTHNV